MKDFQLRDKLDEAFVSIAMYQTGSESPAFLGGLACISVTLACGDANSPKKYRCIL